MDKNWEKIYIYIYIKIFALFIKLPYNVASILVGLNIAYMYPKIILKFKGRTNVFLTAVFAGYEIDYMRAHLFSTFLPLDMYTYVCVSGGKKC